MPFVDPVIQKLARGAGIDVAALLGERRADGAAAAPVDLTNRRPAIVNVGAAISAAAVEAEMLGVSDADQPANDPTTTGGSPPTGAQRDPSRAVRALGARIDAAVEAGQLAPAAAGPLHTKMRRAERLAAAVQFALRNRR